MARPGTFPDNAVADTFSATSEANLCNRRPRPTRGGVRHSNASS